MSSCWPNGVSSAPSSVETKIGSRVEASNTAEDAAVVEGSDRPPAVNDAAPSEGIAVLGASRGSVSSDVPEGGGIGVSVAAVVLVRRAAGPCWRSSDGRRAEKMEVSGGVDGGGAGKR